NGLDYLQLRLVDEALDRLDTGDYGICLGCDEPIAEKRLRALPWARYCVACQESVGMEMNAYREPVGKAWRATLDVRVEHLLDFTLADGADALFHYLAALEEQQGGDAADVVAHGGTAVGVHIELADLGLTGVLAGHYIDGGSHLAARSA